MLARLPDKRETALDWKCICGPRLLQSFSSSKTFFDFFLKLFWSSSYVFIFFVFIPDFFDWMMAWLQDKRNCILRPRLLQFFGGISSKKKLKFFLKLVRFCSWFFEISLWNFLTGCWPGFQIRGSALEWKMHPPKDRFNALQLLWNQCQPN